VIDLADGALDLVGALLCLRVFREGGWLQRGRPRGFLGADMATRSSSPSLEAMKDSEERERFLAADVKTETAMSVAMSVVAVEAEDAVTGTTAADTTSQFNMLKQLEQKLVKTGYKTSKLNAEKYNEMQSMQ